MNTCEVKVGQLRKLHSKFTVNNNDNISYSTYSAGDIIMVIDKIAGVIFEIVTEDGTFHKVVEFNLEDYSDVL